MNNHINYLSITNVKGRTADYELAPVTIIIGDNFSGKTAITDAVKIGLLGYHPSPKLGRLNPSTWKLAGPGKTMKVCMHLGPAVILRTWTKQPNGSIKLESDVPPNMTTPPVLLDTNEYFRLTSAERINYVFRQVPIKDWNDHDALTAISSIEALPFKVAEKKVIELHEEVAGSIKVRDMEKRTVQEWLSQLVKSFKDKKKMVDHTMKSNSAILVSLKQSITEKPEDVSATLQQKQQEREKIMQELFAIDKTAREVKKIEARKKQLNENITLKLQLIDETPDFSEADLVALTEKKKQVNKLRDQLSEIRTKKEVALQLATRRKTLETSAAQNPKQSNLFPTCPKCGYLIGLEEAENKVKKAKEELAKLPVVEIPNNQAELEKQHNELTKEIAALEVKKYGINDRKNLLDQIAILKAELKSLNTFAKLPSQESIDKLTAQAGTLLTEIYDLEAKQNKFTTYVQTKARMAEVNAQLVEQTCHAEVLKKAIEKLEAIQEEQVQETFNALLKKSRLFTDGILLAPLEYRDGDLGYKDDLHWVGHDTFSGTEESLAYAGLSVALTQSAPCKIIIMDELGRLTYDTKYKILCRMEKLIKEGHIDQFIGIDAYNSDYGRMAFKSQNKETPMPAIKIIDVNMKTISSPDSEASNTSVLDQPSQNTDAS